MTTSYIDTILNLLYAGEKVRVNFPTFAQRETFRKKLYTKKKEQDEALLVLLEMPRQMLRVLWPETNTADFTALFWFENIGSKEFAFEILEQVEEKQVKELEVSQKREDETLSANLASTPKQSKENS